VISWRKHPCAAGYLKFDFDPTVEVFVVPSGVWFDTDTMDSADEDEFVEAGGGHRVESA
jgi:hypothetical protein